MSPTAIKSVDASLRNDDKSEPPPHEVELGLRVRALRAARKWTLERASAACGLSRSALSKIENGQMSPTYDALIKLSSGFGIGVSELFASPKAQMGVGRRSICRNGAGNLLALPGLSHSFLCGDLSNKAMMPSLTTVTARSVDEDKDWSHHIGEEFCYVVKGQVRLYTEFYEPVDFDVGDSWYMDSRMGHRLTSISEEDAQVIWVSTTMSAA